MEEYVFVTVGFLDVCSLCCITLTYIFYTENTLLVSLI